jgi:hypothetical protein
MQFFVSLQSMIAEETFFIIKTSSAVAHSNQKVKRKEEKQNGDYEESHQVQARLLPASARQL